MKLLIIVDFQNDYVSGPLGFPGAEIIEDGIIKKIKEYDDFVFTFDTHSKDFQNTLEAKYLDTPHCIKGTEGANLYGKLKDYLDKAKMVFEKETHASLDLALWLKNNPYDEIDLCGITTNQNVLANAIMAKSALPNSKISIIKDLSISNDKVLESRAYDILRGLYIEVK